LSDVPVRAVTLPATPLLVPGAAGSARPLAATRAAVLDALAQVRGLDGAPGRTWGVLASASRTAWDARRASLADAGVADRWVPSLVRAPGPAAGPAASVALWALGAVAGADAVHGVRVVELAAGPGAAPDRDETRALDVLEGLDGLVVAASPQDVAGLTPAGAVLAALADTGGWSPTVVSITEDGPHLPGSYDVVRWDGPQRSANQPTPVSSNQNRTVRPTRRVGT
jgi:hypothetical protein